MTEQKTSLTRSLLSRIRYTTWWLQIFCSGSLACALALAAFQPHGAVASAVALLAQVVKWRLSRGSNGVSVAYTVLFGLLHELRPFVVAVVITTPALWHAGATPLDLVRQALAHSAVFRIAWTIARVVGLS